MQETAIVSNWDSLVFGVPFLAFLVFGFFRLDEVFARHHKPAGRSNRAPSGVDEDGMQILCDPDGRPWKKPRLRHQNTGAGMAR